MWLVGDKVLEGGAGGDIGTGGRTFTPPVYILKSPVSTLNCLI